MGSTSIIPTLQYLQQTSETVGEYESSTDSSLPIFFDDWINSTAVQVLGTLCFAQRKRFGAEDTFEHRSGAVTLFALCVGGQDVFLEHLTIFDHEKFKTIITENTLFVHLIGSLSETVG